MQDSLSKTDGGTPSAPLKCESCGSTEDDVIETTCPYAADVNNDPNVPAVLCKACYQNRCDDI